jgi:hypothetical protein
MLVGEVVALESIDFDLNRHFHAKPLCEQTPRHHFLLNPCVGKQLLLYDNMGMQPSQGKATNTSTSYKRGRVKKIVLVA